jgi:hypothetical protein
MLPRPRPLNEDKTEEISAKLASLMGKYPPAKPGALICEPLKAAIRGR